MYLLQLILSKAKQVLQMHQMHTNQNLDWRSVEIFSNTMSLTIQDMVQDLNNVSDKLPGFSDIPADIKSVLMEAVETIEQVNLQFQLFLEAIFP